jgi:hypothetical protein
MHSCLKRSFSRLSAPRCASSAALEMECSRSRTATTAFRELRRFDDGCGIGFSTNDGRDRFRCSRQKQSTMRSLKSEPFDPMISVVVSALYGRVRSAPVCFGDPTDGRGAPFRPDMRRPRRYRCVCSVAALPCRDRLSVTERGAGGGKVRPRDSWSA